MGSEMCIRDRIWGDGITSNGAPPGVPSDIINAGTVIILNNLVYTCLLYTSDAADERSSVDLGGRRIIKKKKEVYLCVTGMSKTTTCQKQQYTRRITNRLRWEPR